MGRLTKPAGIAALIVIAVMVVTAVVGFAQQQIRLTTIMPTQTQMRGLSGVVGNGPGGSAARTWEWGTYAPADHSFYVGGHLGLGTNQVFTTRSGREFGMVVCGDVDNDWDATMLLVSATRTSPVGMTLHNPFTGAAGAIGLVGHDAHWCLDSKIGDIVVSTGGTHDLRLATDNVGGPGYQPFTRIWIKRDGHVGIGPVIASPNSSCVDPGASMLKVSNPSPGNVNIAIETEGKIWANGNIRHLASTSHSVEMTNTPGYLEYNIDGALWGVTIWASSKRFKEKISDLEVDSSKIYDLKPVSFTWKADRGGKRDFGIIAEDAAKISPLLVSYEKDGKPFSVKYELLSVLLLNELKKKSGEIAALNKKVDELSKRLERLEQRK